MSDVSVTMFQADANINSICSRLSSGTNHLCHFHHVVQSNSIYVLAVTFLNRTQFPGTRKRYRKIKVKTIVTPFTPTIHGSSNVLVCSVDIYYDAIFRFEN